MKNIPKADSETNQNTTGPPAPPTPDQIWARVPSAEEIFNRAPDPVTPIEYPDTLAFEIADREIARRLGNICLYDPPIEEAEIEAFALRAGVSKREAELELRRMRDER